MLDAPAGSRREDSILARVRELMGESPLPLAHDTGSALVYGDPGAPLVLAGHVDTVPAQGNLPGRLDGDGTVHGLGASDMKGGVAVMLELAREAPRDGVAFVFFAREEL